MSNEKENAFKEWFDRGPAAPGHEAIFSAGWDAAFESRPVIVETIRSVARQGERAEIRTRIKELAIAALCAGEYQDAITFSELSVKLFGKLP